jgi:Ca2+-binding RTX toxin-like protein
MRLRVLLSGLTFIAAALTIAWVPLVAHAHQVNPWKACTITGTSGADGLLGTGGRDVICGLGGNDTIAGLGGDDIIRGGPGNDIIQGDSGRDAMLGGPGNDTLYGYDGTHDHMYGGTGYDRARRNPGLDYTHGIEHFLNG